jgi:hypothetical protein
MIVAVDFDGTIVSADHPYGDLKTPLKLLPGAKQALTKLKRRGYVLLLYSARANRAIREDPQLDPLIRAGVRTTTWHKFELLQALSKARYEQMLSFVAEELPGLFSAIDDGVQGKPEADLFIDDKIVGGFPGWVAVMKRMGHER